MRYEEIINEVIQYIEGNLHQSIGTEKIAQLAGLSEFHFHRIFKQTIGLSVSEYTRIRRLANAAIRLLYTKDRIIDIAYDYCFESQEAFTRAFKRYYQIPPGQYRKVMSWVTKQKEENNMNNGLKGWFLSGVDPFNYEIGKDHKVVHQGKASGYIKSTKVLDATHFATMMQQFKADKFIGKRMRLSCFLRTACVQSFSGMWMRVDDAAEDVLQFDNMSNRPIKGDTGWNRYTIVLDIPKESKMIAFGIILSGQGQVWVDHVCFDEVGKDVPTTNLEIEPQLLNEPINLTFEDEI
ncbi:MULTISPECIES: helix-turn-helix transcriptional regulator [Virgibacillus]|uniref:Right origin-binding protein n=1 Tax=Virgibacillus massiliensis TaxID=1462526 RepID=A0A024QHM9_9BACI|nr:MULTISPECIES: AraC family transcriptional regulator [Virgibacillus]CDQ41979.1 Right origin-binding protein [Virgibacillus massiliensis]